MLHCMMQTNTHSFCTVKVVCSYMKLTIKFVFFVFFKPGNISENLWFVKIKRNRRREGACFK